MLQEQMNVLQVKLDDEEHKNLKLQQYIDKVEHHSVQMQEVRLRVWPWRMNEQILKVSVTGRKGLHRVLVKSYLSGTVYSVAWLLL